MLERDAEISIDAAWWSRSMARSLARRAPLADQTNAYRVVHGEGDGLPSLVVDRYDRWLVVQLLSAGLEACRNDVLGALSVIPGIEGILLRNDAAVRTREGLDRSVEVVSGSVPEEIEVREGSIRYVAAPHTGQKTGGFLDQRENRLRVGRMARGRALDCFSYHGSFALHLARGAESVVSIDSSAAALERGRANALLNGLENIEFVQADAFEDLRRRERSRERFDVVVVDPPAFAKSRASLGSAIRGYQEVNLRAMRLLAEGGMLFSASCSHHLSLTRFLDILVAAAADSGRRLVLREILGQPFDHPQLLTIPESGYLKGALLEAVD